MTRPTPNAGEAPPTSPVFLPAREQQNGLCLRTTCWLTIREPHVELEVPRNSLRNVEMAHFKCQLGTVGSQYPTSWAHSTPPPPYLASRANGALLGVQVMRGTRSDPAQTLAESEVATPLRVPMTHCLHSPPAAGRSPRAGNTVGANDCSSSHP